MEVDALWNIGKTAEILQTTPGALYVQRHRNVAPGSLGVKVGRRLLWRASDIHAWFDEQLKEQQDTRARLVSE